MGGEPLDRSGGMNKVDSIAAIFSRRKVFVLPWLRKELTNKSEPIFKTGFMLHLILEKVNFPS
jgi:hypothetical protein